MPSTDRSAKPAAAGLPPDLPRGCSNFRLHALVRRLDQLYDAELAKVGLRTTQYSLLSQVVRMGPVRPGVLAQAMHLQPSSLTRNLQPLVAAGWVELGAGDDARSRSVSATDAGRDKRAQAQRRWKAAQLAVNAALSPARVVALHTLMDECMNALVAPPDADMKEPAND